MNLDKIKTQTTWNDASASINSNFLKLKDSVTALENSSYKNKGYFLTVNSLNEAYPTSTAGSRAFVGASYPYRIYLWDNGQNGWIDSGEEGGEDNMPLGDYYTKDETHEVMKEYHEVLSQAEYDALTVKEDKFYFTY